MRSTCRSKDSGKWCLPWSKYLLISFSVPTLFSFFSLQRFLLLLSSLTRSLVVRSILSLDLFFTLGLSIFSSFSHSSILFALSSLIFYPLFIPSPLQPSVMLSIRCCPLVPGFFSFAEKHPCLVLLSIFMRNFIFLFVA